ncbi:hypothetical protein [Ureibacillus manganicus]|uniref:hypothetical protein n=1 Tax=Ureibacillus manganicus TaxID=1266064 RepID=UPI001125181D|nr:hypothetical protein [Ureibacillus manganicus]
MIIYLLVTQVLYVFSVPFWWGMWLISTGNVNRDNLEIQVLDTIVIFLYPIIIIVSAIISWLFYRKKSVTAFFINLSPVIVITGFIVYLNFRFWT